MATNINHAKKCLRQIGKQWREGKNADVLYTLAMEALAALEKATAAGNGGV